MNGALKIQNIGSEAFSSIIDSHNLAFVERYLNRIYFWSKICGTLKKNKHNTSLGIYTLHYLNSENFFQFGVINCEYHFVLQFSTCNVNEFFVLK